MTRTSRGLVGMVATVALALAAFGGVPGTAMAADAPTPADPNAVVTFLVGLPYREKALEAAAQAVSTPGTNEFRRYSTVKQVARTFGATAQTESALKAAAQRLGLTARIDATRLFARVSGTVASWQTALGEPVKFRAAEPGSAQDPDAPPFNLYAFLDSTEEQYAPLPAALKSKTTWFLPLFSQYVASLDVAGAVMSKQTRELIYPGLGDAVPPTNGGTPLGQTCQTGDLAARTFTPFQLSQAYGLAPLQNAIAKGVQPRIAVLSLGGGFAQSDVDAAAACFGHTAPVVDVKTGLGIDTPIVSLSGESALDLQTVSWAAQNLKSVRFIQVVNSTPSFIEAYALALTAWPTPPDAITNSWGTCELAPEAGAGSLSTVESLLQYAALVGTSSFVASGDRGSSACQTTGGDPSNPRPTVQYPGSSPFITAVGGTQLNLGAENARIGESVWNDLQYGLTGNAVGTGGPSAVFDAPWYQRPITGSDVRSVPDIAAQAGAGPGTTIYFGGQAVGPTGGTSQASPLVATGFAMLSSQMRAKGYAPLGFVNPWLYRTARFHDGSIYDVTVGSNQYPLVYAESSLNAPACCQAQSGFDAASGLGAPIFNLLTPHSLTATAPKIGR